MTATESQGRDPAADSVERRIADGPRGGARTWFDVLEVGGDVSPADLTKAYERALSLVEGRSIGGYLMLDPMAAESARADVEAAYAVLSDPERRRAYQERLAANGEAPPTGGTAASAPAGGAPDAAATERSSGPIAGWSAEGEPVSGEATAEARAILGLPEGDASAEERRSSQLKFLAPDGNAAAPPRTETPRPGSLDIRFAAPSTDSGPSAAMPASPPLAPPVREVAETAPSSATGSTPPAAAVPDDPARPLELPEEITGALVRELRMARGLSIDEMSQQTKVRRGVLQAIEEQDLPNLPARVYLRGFLTQVGRVLKVDRNRLAEGYVKTVERLQRG
ncbi:MAG: helix-turn-helix domain-containing protein [Deltaproteobacteria bacterium]|nr:helix-turn-helix domain-containing protein [Deltaproteobacteria bacterium]